MKSERITFESQARGKGQVRERSDQEGKGSGEKVPRK